MTSAPTSATSALIENLAGLVERVTSHNEENGFCVLRLRARGHLVLTVLGMVAQMERRFIKEHQREGIAREKGDGAYTGGKRRLDRDRVRALHAAGSGPAVIAREVGCSRMQVYRVLQEIWPGPGDSSCRGP